ncbi:hypothetical protein [Cellulomonas wangsupingiae]|uniref:ACT domain-containing protein n=1 Tax=Cellulomonas wangsupingiae TaxID=2968085 RepID=A0ABY5KCU3_9CELL|nr:hypothetical protein [Cellulomonas wangsupingiae]MCC2333100.1 hypothetical protein [Cellulomonas wangsupingiae]UUI66816.1 hypothetical protein NP075_08990 [Cellulomonas wangsupingiae]
MSGRSQDLEVVLPARRDAWAELGEVLGLAGVCLEGGGVVTHAGAAVAHYLVDDGPLALRALARAGFDAVTVRDVVTTRVSQGVPGSLGALARRLAEAGVDVAVQYSDHAGNLVLVVADEDLERCRRVLTADGTTVV